MTDFNLFGGDAPQTPLTGPESAPAPRKPDTSKLGSGPIFEEFDNNSTKKDIPEFQNVAELVGKAVVQNNSVIDELDWRQRKYICILAKALYMQEKPINGQAIHALWPVGLNKANKVSKEITDPAERGKVFRAGHRPALSQIQEFLITDYYREYMGNLGIAISDDDMGLTAEQVGIVTILANPSDGKDLKRKLRDAGISWAKFEVWLKQPHFKEFYDKRMTDSLKQMIPMAQQQIAAKMAAGDTNAIKFGMELTGFYNPNDKRQVDATALVQIILGVIEEEETDPEKLKRIAAKISLRGAKALGGGSSSVV
jgi:hypothetical protein